METPYTLQSRPASASAASDLSDPNVIFKLVGCDCESEMGMKEEQETRQEESAGSRAICRCITRGCMDSTCLTLHHSKTHPRPVARIPGTESVEFYSGKIYYLEYDTLRGGNFDALELLPATKNVVLGIVTTKSATLEKPEELKAKVLEAAEVIARGDNSLVEEALLRIGVSPQCGFARTLKGNSLTMDEMAAKLSLVKQLADEIVLNSI